MSATKPRRGRVVKEGGLFVFRPPKPGKPVCMATATPEELSELRATLEALTPRDADLAADTVERARKAAWRVLGPAVGVERANHFIRLRASGQWVPKPEGMTVEEFRSTADATAFGHNLAYQVLGTDPPSEVTWASRLVWAADRLEDAIKSGNAAASAHLGEDVGTLLVMGYVEFGVGRIVHAGRRVIAGVDDHAEARRGKRKPKTETMLAEMARLISGGLSAKEAARRAHKAGLGKSTAAIERAWRRSRQN